MVVTQLKVTSPFKVLVFRCVQPAPLQSGVDVFRVFDSLNYVDNIKFGIDTVRRANGVVEATICYTGDVSDPTKVGLPAPPGILAKLVANSANVPK